MYFKKKIQSRCLYFIAHTCYVLVNPGYEYASQKCMNIYTAWLFFIIIIKPFISAKDVFFHMFYLPLYT